VITGLLDDFRATGGGTIRLLLADGEAMAFLDTRMTDTGFTLGEHIRCCVQELDRIDEFEVS
jgi:hypothetical protein